MPPDLSLQHLNIIIPDGVKFDGVQEGVRGQRLLCFTITDLPKGYGMGASFSIGETEITSALLAIEASRMRRKFAPLPPVAKRVPIPTVAETIL